MLKLCCSMIASKRRRKIDFNEEYSGGISRIAEYICKDAPLYGFMLKGSVGNGKSTLLEALNEMTNAFVREGLSETKHIFKLVTSQEIADAYMRDRTKYNELLNANFVIVDEFGDEPLQVMEYGTPACPIHNFLYERYRRIKFTVIGTNLTLHSMTQRYDERLIDRLREMYPPEAQITFTHPSYR